VIVRGYDAAKDAVTVDYNGQSITLTLHTAKIVSAPATLPAVPTPIGGPVVLNPTPADEQRRLEAIAAEVNRRRQLRQQAMMQQQQQQQQQANPPR
jgi:hypothetical protein